jgi:hypothetical protein
MHTLYLVATIDVRGPLPVIVHVGTYSESWKTLTLQHAPGRCYCDLAEAKGDDFEDAEEKLRELLREYHGLRWALDWLDRGGTPLGGDR